MKTWIFPSELIIDPSHPVTVEIQDKMLKYHIMQVNCIRDKYGFPIWASQKSGYRPKSHEIANGRKPDGVRRLHYSRHTYLPAPGDMEGKGATDWTCDKQNRVEFAIHLWEETDYNRIALYEWGFHCDYKNMNGRQLIIAENWQPVQMDSFISEIKRLC